MDKCSDFYFYFILFIFFSLIRSLFHLDTNVNFVAMRKLKVCLPVCLNICLGYKSRKNWSIPTKFGEIFAVSNLNLYTKNWDCMIDTFYRDKSKSWIFDFIYVSFSVRLCDNNVTTRSSSITVFNNNLQLRNLVQRQIWF